MLNKYLATFIKNYCNGSRKDAGKAIGCSDKLIGQMLRGEMAIPLLRAFYIEKASGGEILVEALIIDQNLALAKAIHQSRQRSIENAKKEIEATYNLSKKVTDRGS